MRMERQFIAVAAAGLALTLAACGGSGKAGGPLTTIKADEPSLGKTGAPVTIIEYASTACGHCAAFNNDVFHEFKAKHIDNGDVHYAMREIVTPPESFASASFILARCAPADKYYPIIDAVFRGQYTMLTTNTAAEGLKQIAVSSGMSEADFDKCLQDEGNFDALQKRLVKNANEGKITATPTFYVNGVKHEGELTLAALSKAVTDAKAKAK